MKQKSSLENTIIAEKSRHTFCDNEEHEDIFGRDSNTLREGNTIVIVLTPDNEVQEKYCPYCYYQSEKSRLRIYRWYHNSHSIVGGDLKPKGGDLVLGDIMFVDSG